MAVQEQALRRKSLLVVDDHDSSRIIFTEALSDLGYNVLTAPTAEEGFEIARDAQDVACVLADVFFPGQNMDGLGLVAKIREEGIGTPVILTSSSPTVDLLARALNQERDVVIGFVPKGELAIDSLSRDISDLVTRYEARKKSQATDLKSGVLNWNYFTKELKGEVSRAYRSGEPLSLIFTDLDNFKRINDNLGHDVGDKVLKAIGSYLKEKLREYDLVGRNSDAADEFAIALPNAKTQDAQHIIERLTSPSDIATYVRSQLPREVYPITLSCGIATYTGNGANITKRTEINIAVDSLIRTAMKRQEEAKRQSHRERQDKGYRTIIRTED